MVMSDTLSILGENMHENLQARFYVSRALELNGRVQYGAYGQGVAAADVMGDS